MIDQWTNCYDDGWQGLIVPESFSHPAKFSRGLIHRIYKHAKEMGWVKPGDWVLDPFGGVALGGVDALSMGLNWVGVELEETFVKLGQQNIELWQCQLEGWPNLGTARIVQGDSRKLSDILYCLTGDEGKFDLVVSSPPFTGITGNLELDPKFYEHPTQKQSANYSTSKSRGADYGHTPGNLANMKEGDIDLVVSSPPYVDVNCKKEFTQEFLEGQRKSHPGRSDKALKKMMDKWNGLQESPGQLGAMREGEFDLCVSSPPYCEIASGAGGLNTKPPKHSGQQSGRNLKSSSQDTDQHYGKSEGQLSGMPEGSFDLIASSPPYEESLKGTGLGIDFSKTKRDGDTTHWKTFSQGRQAQGFSKDNLSQTSGNTFWSASKEIVQGCFDLLKPGGHAIWVCKDYIKAKKRVPFSDRWLALCESVGFRLACRHQAMLVKEHGTQTTIHGDKKITTERKSFFRRLAESKGSPRIDWEDVLCMEKI